MARIACVDMLHVQRVYVKCALLFMTVYDRKTTDPIPSLPPSPNDRSLFDMSGCLVPWFHGQTSREEAVCAIEEWEATRRDGRQQRGVFLFRYSDRQVSRSIGHKRGPVFAWLRLAGLDWPDSFGSLEFVWVVRRGRGSATAACFEPTRSLPFLLLWPPDLVYAHPCFLPRIACAPLGPPAADDLLLLPQENGRQKCSFEPHGQWPPRLLAPRQAQVLAGSPGVLAGEQRGLRVPCAVGAVPGVQGGDRVAA